MQTQIARNSSSSLKWVERLMRGRRADQWVFCACYIGSLAGVDLVGESEGVVYGMVWLVGCFCLVFGV